MFFKLFSSLINTGQYRCNYYCQNEIIASPKCIFKKVYLIKDGIVKVSSITEKGEETILVVLTIGQIFGANLVLESLNFNHIYESINYETILYEFDIDCIHKLMKENHVSNKDLLLALGKQHIELEQRIKSLSNNNTEQRLMDVLIEFKEKFKDQSDNYESCVFHMPLNQEELSNYLGVCRVTINKTINKLKKTLLIEYNQKTITLKRLFFEYYKKNSNLF